MFLLKTCLKSTQNHDMAKKGWGFSYLLVFRLAYYIQVKFKGSFQLPRNRFMSWWEFNFWAQSKIWWNLDFGHIFLPFYVLFKMVRKYDQNRDFTKFHSAPKNWILIMTQNGFGGGERTLWTSFGCNMEVWTPTGTKTPSILATSWFWVFFRRLFKENTYLGNKRSSY